MSLIWIISILENSLQKQGIFGDPLHGNNQDVHQPEPVTVTLGFTPLKIDLSLAKTQGGKRQ